MSKGKKVLLAVVAAILVFGAAIGAGYYLRSNEVAAVPAPAPTPVAQVIVADLEKFAMGTKSDLLFDGWAYIGQRQHVIDGGNITVDVWAQVNSSGARVLMGHASLELYLNPAGLPVSITDGERRCDFKAGSPMTIRDLVDAWDVLGVLSVGHDRTVKNHYGKPVWFHCTKK